MVARSEAMAAVAAVAVDDPPVPAGWALRGVREQSDLLALVLSGRDLGPNRRRLAEALDGLDRRHRTRLFEAWAPHVGEDLSRWWEWSASLPYHGSTWGEPVLRSPRPELTHHARVGHLVRLLRVVRRHPRDLHWLAAYAPWLGYASGDEVGLLLAAAVSEGDNALRDLLVDALHGTGDQPLSGAHAVVGLLAASDAYGWSTVEQLLGDAGREEGLRRLVLGHLQFAHPTALERLLTLVADRGLTRFASVTELLAGWLGDEFSPRQADVLAGHLRTFAEYLAGPPGPGLLRSLPGAEVHLALRATGVRDVMAATRMALDVARSEQPDVRLAALRFLGATGFVVAFEEAVAHLDDPDPRVAAVAWTALHRDPFSLAATGSAVSLDRDTMVHALAALPAPGSGSTTVPVGLVGRCDVKTGRDQRVEVLVGHLAPADFDLLDELLLGAPVDARTTLVLRLADEPDRHRDRLIGFLADKAERPRTFAQAALEAITPPLSEAEAVRVEGLLSGSRAEVRSAALGLLLGKQDPDAARASAARLQQGSAAQRRAGNELAATLGMPLVQDARTTTRAARRAAPAPEPVLPPAADWAAVLAVLDGPRSEPRAPVLRTDWSAVHDAVPMLLDSLAAVPDLDPDAVTEALWRPGQVELPEPLRGWWAQTRPRLPGGGAECLVIGLVGQQVANPYTVEWYRRLGAEVLGPALDRLVEQDHLARVIGAVGTAMVEPAWVSWALDLFESAALRAGDPKALREHDRVPRLVEARWLEGGLVDDHDLARLWGLFRHLEAGRWPTSPKIAAIALDRGIATAADFASAIMDGYLLDSFTSATPPRWLPSGSTALALARDLTQAAAWRVAAGPEGAEGGTVLRQARRVEGADLVVHALVRLGGRPLVTGYLFDTDPHHVLCQVVRISRPAPHDTAQSFAEAVRAARIPERRLLELALYAPQWAAWVQVALARPGLESAAWWLKAHTKGDDWRVDGELVGEWVGEVARYTALTDDDLARGAADAGWFHRVREDLGDQHLDALVKVAKVAGSAGGHKRAELFARALRGRVTEDELVDAITGKRHQDSVRALGLLPLPAADPERRETLLRRYELLRGFVAGDRTSGSARRASETTAVEVGMENLARAAGYTDPQRLTWAMEREAVRDLVAGPVSVADGDLVVTLAIAADGAPELSVRRGDRRLAAVPKASAKHEGIAALKSRATALRSQAARMRASLEQACVLGEELETAELDELLGHPVLRAMVADLVLVSAEGTLGFATASAAELYDENGDVVPADGSPMRVAHPLDLLSSGRWHSFQRSLFTGHRKQPFRQVFRELYVPVPDEGPESTRYAGQQVQVRRAHALLRGRGWVFDWESAGFGRTFHRQGWTAWCTGEDLHPGTGIEDGTVGTVHFARAGSWEPVPLAEVPGRLFSEVMRDLDLVVSVAHASGVDPEASMSTVESRAALLQETCRLLGLDNVEVRDRFAHVTGSLAGYRVHLGSGVVHREPGGSVFLVPVAEQHRGRVFLPFADDDPRTAEVVSKVLLLARDTEVKDPAIRAQLT